MENRRQEGTLQRKSGCLPLIVDIGGWGLVGQWTECHAYCVINTTSRIACIFSLVFNAGVGSLLRPLQAPCLFQIHTIYTLPLDGFGSQA
eukprot:scaffold667_cov117-Cylindrotheca_fusiformis.AAC.4